MGETIIKQKREELGLSQSRFSEMSGVNFRTLQDYEQGRKPIPSIKGEVLYRISSSLGCSMEEILLDSMKEDVSSSMARILSYKESLDRMLDRRHSGRLVGTPFDDVFRTLSVDCSSLLVPIINLIFGEDYDVTAVVEQGQNEHFMHRDDGSVEKKITDENCVILEKDGRRKRYQVECQSRGDNTILVRMFEYATEIALENGHMEDDTLHVEYPRSALLYLRHTKNTPDKMKVLLHTPGGEIGWDVPVMKAQEYSVEDIFEKHLYMLVPFYLLTYEKQLPEIERNHERVMKLKGEYERIFERLEDAVQKGFLNTHQWIVIRNTSKRILEYLTGNYNEINTEVKSIMGGEVIEYEGRQQWLDGIAKGRMEGLLLGSEKKLAEQVSRKLKKGKSPELIAEELDEEFSVIQGIIEDIQEGKSFL